MNFIRLIVLSALFLMPAKVIIASVPTISKISSWKLVSDNSEQLDAIAKKFEIVSRKGNEFEIYVLETALYEFRSLAPTATLISTDTDADVQRAFLESLTFVDGYRDFNTVNKTLFDLSQKYPQFVQLILVGESTKGLPQYALKISDNVTIDENEPELLMTAATHGDEIITTEVLLRFIEEIVGGYEKSNSRIATLINNHELFFVPVVNPDGFTVRSRYAGNIDPNRDYPWPGHENKESVKPIANMINFYTQHKFAGSIDFHAYGQMVMYPWAYTKTPPVQAHEQVFSKLGQDMSQLNSYTYGQISRVIYIAEGSSADYYYWKFNSLAYGVEMGTSKAPSVEQIPNVLNQVREMTYRFIEHF